MRTHLSYFWENISGSFWFIPLMIILLSLGLAVGFLYLDTQVELAADGLFSFMLVGGDESARYVLSTIAGAMLGVAGTVFSITLVALTLASSQFGARLLRNFMYDRINQTVLGVYVATFLYSLLVLRAVKSSDDSEFIPDISILFAILLAFGSIILLIVFIHHISISIQADQVISDVNKNLEKSIKKLFPIDLGTEEIQRDNEKDRSDSLLKLPYKDQVDSSSNGYLEAIDNDKLMKIAKENNLLFTLSHRPGDYIVQNMELVLINAIKPVEEKVKNEIRKTFILGKVRTPSQDAEFSFHQIVEVTSRALSTGLNDPYTAITCIDKLTASFCYLTRAKFPSPFRYDDENHLRVIAKTLTFSGIMDVVFNQIRQTGKDIPAVIIRLMEALGVIHDFATKTEHKESILRHAEMVLNAARQCMSEEKDFEDMQSRYRKIIAEDQ